MVGNGDGVFFLAKGLETSVFPRGEGRGGWRCSLGGPGKERGLGKLISSDCPLDPIVLVLVYFRSSSLLPLFASHTLCVLGVLRAFYARFCFDSPG